ncbi:MAG: hypothetical protein HS115_11700 [Spirochaetales bacterium]|nr:hypothetical protein [Spirochaetales bacterium]
MFARLKKLIAPAFFFLFLNREERRSLFLGGSGSGDRASAAMGSKFSIEQVQPDFPIDFLDLIQRLVMITPDLSQAVKRIVQLANTGLEFELEDASDEMREKARLEIKDFLAAHPSIINRLIRQVALTGAVSAEAVPNLDMKGLAEMRPVRVASVRFAREEARGRTTYVPHQLIQNGYALLNPRQYYYEALETTEESPYAIPPFIAAIESVFIQKDASTSIKSVLGKLGLLGFLHVVRRRPRPRPGDRPEELAAREEKELQLLRDSALSKLSKGLIVSYDDVSTEHAPVTGDTRGFDSVWKTNEEQIASGLDIDPAILGRSYSTTETYAGVVFTAFVRKLANLRHPVENFLKFALTLHLRSLGYQFSRLSAQWGNDAAIDRQADALAEKARAETEQLQIGNVLTKKAAGIIGLDDAARELGYERATGKEEAGQAGAVIDIQDYVKKKQQSA